MNENQSKEPLTFNGMGIAYSNDHDFFEILKKYHIAKNPEIIQLNDLQKIHNAASRDLVAKLINMNMELKACEDFSMSSVTATKLMMLFKQVEKTLNFLTDIYKTIESRESINIKDLDQEFMNMYVKWKEMLLKSK